MHGMHNQYWRDVLVQGDSRRFLVLLSKAWFDSMVYSQSDTVIDIADWRDEHSKT